MRKPTFTRERGLRGRFCGSQRICVPACTNRNEQHGTRPCLSTGLYQPQHATETNRTRHKADPRCTRELARRPGAGPEEQITSDLARKVAAHLVKYHGWAKVQRLEDGRKISRFYQPSARMVTAEPPAHTGLHPRGCDRVVTHERTGRCEPARSQQNIRERWPEAEKRPSSLNSLAIRTPEPARTAGRQQSKPTTRRHKGAD